MSKESLGSFQFKIRDMVPDQDCSDKENITVYHIKKDTIIYPQSSGRGVVLNDFYADRLPDIKVRGYTGYATRSSITLYLDGRYWNIVEGSKVGIPSTRVKKINIPLK
jgi:hypothetical protein